MSSRSALLALVALVTLFCAPIVLRGRVIYPHDNRVELGDSGHDPEFDGLPQNRKFADQSSFYIPEIHHHLNGDSSAWLSTWNPHVEMGRPSSHVSGFSPAFIVTRVLSWLTRDAFVLYTALTLLTLALTGVFAFLFLDALGLHPWACFAGAAGLALGVFAVYWLTFVMFLSGLCWTLGIAWLVVRFLERATFARAAGIAFCVHALLLTAYPQQIVWHGYLLILFTSVRWWRTPARTWGLRGAAGIFASVVAGAALSAPVYADLALAAWRSSRIGADPAFFLPALPAIESWRDFGAFLGQIVDAFQIGNPIAPDYQARFNGLCLTPFFAALVLASVLEGGWRRSGMWLGFALVCLVLTVWPGAYLFGVAHLGLSFSRFVPLAAALIPFGVAGAIALDRIIRLGFARPWIAVLVGSAAPIASIGFQPGPNSAASIAVGLALFVGFAALVLTRRAWLVPLLVVATVGLYGARLVLARPEASIARDSALVQRLREMTNQGGRHSRYAFVGAKGAAVLPPNEEALVGLRSVHSYDSLSSRSFQEWVLRLSTIGARTFGRHFARIADASKLTSSELQLARISTIVSMEALQSAALLDSGMVGPFHLYGTAAPPIGAFQADAFRLSSPERDAILSPGRFEEATRLPMEVVEERDDRVRANVSAVDHPTLLVLSCQHHPHWEATLDVSSVGKARGDVVRFDGFYLGVIVQPGTRSVELVFRPWTRLMWISQALLILTAGVVLLRAARGPRPTAAPADDA